MTEPDRTELQRIAQLVEVNRERLQALEQQLRNLEGIKLEQEHALEALLSISQDGADGAMIPLGAGVQLVADIPPDGGAVIDICLLYTSPSPRDIRRSRMPSSA